MARITAKYPGKCEMCKGAFEAGTEIVWTPGHAKHAEPMACAETFKAAEAAEAAEKKAAWEAELAAMTPEELEWHEMEKWNTGHGLCPEGCCGHVVECEVPGCECHGHGGEGVGEDRAEV